MQIRTQFDVLLILLVAVAALALLSRKIASVPKIHLNPQLIFIIFLPPLLFPAALFTSWRDFHANLRPIGLLAVGLVLFTTVSVGYFTHYLIAGFPLAAAFILGAIISPPDAVAATAITERLRVPQRVVTVIEGESLVNDAIALVALQFAVTALGTGSFSLAKASLHFVVVGVGGILMGLAVGWLA